MKQGNASIDAAVLSGQTVSLLFKKIGEQSRDVVGGSGAGRVPGQIDLVGGRKGAAGFQQFLHVPPQLLPADLAGGIVPQLTDLGTEGLELTLGLFHHTVHRFLLPRCRSSSLMRVGRIWGLGTT